MTVPPASSASMEHTKMLFLVGHGLQSPLSTIRWGCGRLSRTGTNLTKKQKDLLEDMVEETRTVSRMIDWLLLLAKVEEGIHVPNVQDVYINDFLRSSVLKEQMPQTLKIIVKAPKDLKIRIDRRIFESIMNALLLTVATGSDAKRVTITAVREGNPKHCLIRFAAPLKLSFLEETQDNNQSKRRVVGGVPGFLLSTASSLAGSVRGTLESAGTAPKVNQLLLRLPLYPSISSLPTGH